MEIKDIKSINFPFSLYDFFGYLFPGGTFWVLVFFSKDIHLLLQDAIGNSEINGDASFFYEDFAKGFDQSPVLGFLMIVLASYITGHVIASISSWVFERILVEKCLKYPGVNMFNTKPAIENSKGKSWVSHWLKRAGQFIRNAIIGKFKKAYSLEFISKYDELFAANFNINANDPSDKFWLSFEYIAFHCPVTLSRTLHFLNLYGFSRNLAMTFTIAACIQACWRNWWETIIYLFIAGTLFINYLKLLRRTNDEVFRGFYVKTAGNATGHQYDTNKTY